MGWSGGVEVVREQGSAIVNLTWDVERSDNYDDGVDNKKSNGKKNDNDRSDANGGQSDCDGKNKRTDNIYKHGNGERVGYEDCDRILDKDGKV